jgi:hypothetical protein
MPKFQNLPHGKTVQSVQEYEQTTIIEKIQASLTGKHHGQSWGSRDQTIDGGVCLGFSTEWILKSFQGGATDSFWNWLDSPNAPGTLRELGHRVDQGSKALDAIEKHTQESEMDETEVEGLRKVVQKVIKGQGEWQSTLIQSTTKGGLKRCGVFRKFTNANDLARESVAHEGFALVHILGGRNSSGHAMALHYSPKTGVRFMDPNCGELCFQKRNEFQTWLATYHLKGETEFGLECFPASGGLKPPVPRVKPSVATLLKKQGLSPPVPGNKPWLHQPPTVPGKKPSLEKMLQSSGSIA